MYINTYVCIYGHVHKDVSTFYHPNAYMFSTMKAGTLKETNKNKTKDRWICTRSPVNVELFVTVLYIEKQSPTWTPMNLRC